MASISRTYRPQNFSEFNGQESIKETLRLEVETGKIGNAYIFGGPRGVGKTTMARVFGKALNCLNPSKGEPCNECAACAEFTTGRSLDFIEMDAASNTGVDNVREAIIEHVRFAPHARKYKIYVLDEAHMLSTSAWNALLKTIEEPPPYAKFIFVTTELHKVPATILSRCQRFDFKRVSDEALTERLIKISGREGLSLDPSVIASIVSRSDGCVRDAESLLGQLLVLGEKNITSEIAGLVLPVTQLPIAARILTVWSQRHLEPALKIVEDTEEQGIQLTNLFDDMIRAVRLLLLAADSQSWRAKMEKGDEGEKILAALRVFGAEELSDMALMLMERRRDAKQGADPRFCMELAAAAVSLGLLPHAPKVETKNDKPPEANKDPSTGSGRQNNCHPEPRIECGVNSAKAQSKDLYKGETSSGSNVNLSLGSILQKWPALIRLIDQKSPSLTFILKISQPIAIEGEVVTVRFQYSFHREKIIEDIKIKRLVEECLREAVGDSRLRLEGIIGKADEPLESSGKDAVSTILNAFGGQVVEEGQVP
ncbi:MAG: DNA polymerase III subunit gamma/tau [Patescibacteria group bacterium]